MNQGQKMQASDLKLMEEPSKEKPTGNKKNKGKGTRHVTNAVGSGLQKGALKVKLKEKDEGYFNYSFPRVSPFLSHDSNILSRLPSLSMFCQQVVLPIRMVKPMPAGSFSSTPYAVIGPGATEDIVGGLGWRI